MTSGCPGPGLPERRTVQTPARPAPARTRRTARLVGVDVARGLALLGMIAVHVFDEFDDRGNPSLATVTAGGRSAALFALVAGLGLALLTGGRRPVAGPSRTAAAAGLAVRALLVGLIGLSVCELVGAASGVAVILPYYGMLFLLAIPLLGMRARELAVLTAALVAVAPVVVLWTVAEVGEADLDAGGNLTFVTLFDEPGGFLAALFVTGTYPVLIYLVYLAAGMALGRLDLSRRLVGVAVMLGGLVLAIGSRVLSELLLFRAGGVDELLDLDGESAPRRELNELLWDSDESVESWWYLVVPAPHSGTPFDLMNTLGSGMAVVGAALLVCRLGIFARLLWPLAAAGSMTLTLYVGHLLILATGLFEDQIALYVVLVAGVLGFGHFWRRNLGQGPLERVVASGAGLVRRSVAARQRA